MKPKNYYYLLTVQNRSKNGGTNTTAEVFTTKRSEIIRLGSVHWNTASYKGQLSCVYGFLRSKNLVTKKEYEKNNGYYENGSKSVKISIL